MYRSVLEYNHETKAMILGDPGVGKTNILYRFVKNEFRSCHISTGIAEILIKDFQLGDKTIKIKGMDMAIVR